MYSLLPILYYIIIRGVTGLVINVPDHKVSDYNVCNTTTCRKFGQTIKNSMNNSVEPCIDFYEYGCGSWAAYNPIPSNTLSWSVNDQIAMKIYSRIREILEKPSEYDNMPPIKMVKQYYRSCMDEDAIEKQGLAPMQSLLEASGGWPILMSEEEWKMRNYTWQDIDNFYNQLFSGSSFFTTIIDLPDEQDSTQKRIVVSPNIAYPMSEKNQKARKKEEEYDEEYDEEEFDSIYVQTVIKVIFSFAKDKGVDISMNRLTTEVAELLFFDSKLRNITEYETRDLQEGKNQSRMTIAELQEYYDLANTQQPTSKIDWLHTIQFIFEPVNITINASEPVIVYSKHLLHELARLLDDTPPRVIVNYIQWNIVSKFMSYLNKLMRDIEFETYYSYYNITEQDPRWETCIKEILMGDAVSYLFVKKYLPTDTLKAVTEMVEDIKAEIKTRILRSTWTNDATKNFMISKIDNLLPQIGYPKWYDNQTAFIESYNGLEIGENFFKNALAIAMYENKRELMAFREPVDRNEWTDYPITVNAFYLKWFNSIVIPASQILDPYFTAGMPLAINYAAVGYTLGHELTHSFDSDGIQFDKFGNKLSWHSKETNDAYDKKAKCFVDQYSNFTLDVMDEEGENIQLDGELTKDENMADSIGLQIAFAAFQKRKEMAGPQLKLPGLEDISDEQLFFLSYVYTWCYSSVEAYEEDYVNTDEHSPPKFRVIGPLANMNSFSNAFNCPVDSPMNPESKCNLWK